MEYFRYSIFFNESHDIYLTTVSEAVVFILWRCFHVRAELIKGNTTLINTTTHDTTWHRVSGCNNVATTL